MRQVDLLNGFKVKTVNEIELMQLTGKNSYEEALNILKEANLVVKERN